MDIQTYFRKAFSVEAVQVTDNNINEVAEWCGGKLNVDQNGKAYLRVDVHKPMSPRQTKAFLGDWLLKSNRGFKVYTDVAFQNGFLKDEDGQISQGWENVIKNVFDTEAENVGHTISESIAIAGKR